MPSSGSIASDAEYADYVQERLNSVAIYEPGAFSCSSLDDDDVDDVDVKRILAEYGGGLELSDCDSVGFSSAYNAAAAAVAVEEEVAEDEVTGDFYEHWDEALRDVSAVYPPLGVSRAVTGSETLVVPKTGDLTSRMRTIDKCHHDGKDDKSAAGARELRKCLEGALYGRDAEEFVIAQPYCIADKNLDFGKSNISHKAVNESRKKVEDWISKYLIVGQSECRNVVSNG
ncbi:Hypothetical protein CINCED_3A024545 [Cinara cedri]|uniref:Uncharacterized protein n=1 Tax=Cinara cedri TaxID=506608 RepID=A0A5E4N9E9_9HEMI|nr:Hypothetical protein CINCED_3A024545 [Cinara cedri]